MMGLQEKKKQKKLSVAISPAIWGFCSNTSPDEFSELQAAAQGLAHKTASNPGERSAGRVFWTRAGFLPM